MALLPVCHFPGQHRPSKGLQDRTVPFWVVLDCSHSLEVPAWAHQEPVASPAVDSLLTHEWGWGECFGGSHKITHDNDDVPPVVQAGINGLHCAPVPGCARWQCGDTHTLKITGEMAAIFNYTLTLCLGQLFIHMASLNPCSRPRKWAL